MPRDRPSPVYRGERVQAPRLQDNAHPVRGQADVVDEREA